MLNIKIKSEMLQMRTTQMAVHEYTACVKVIQIPMLPLVNKKKIDLQTQYIVRY